MARFLIQSRESGRFLAPDPECPGSVAWLRSLALALLGGVVSDPEHVEQLLEDHCDRWAVDVLDLDSLLGS